MDQLRLLVDELPSPPEAPPDDTPPATSVTELVTLAECPKRFYWSEIDRLPRQPAKWLRRGVEVHRQIELHNLGRMAFDDVRDDLYDAIDDDPSDEPIGSALGAFRSSRFAAVRPRFVEAPIDLRIGGARIRGRIDAIYEPRPGHWEIVDFKSGVRRDHPSLMVQLQAYAVAAADGAVAIDRPDSMTVTFAYLGGGELDEVSVDVTDDWLDQARSQLAGLAGAMQGDAFEPRSGPGCARCDFVRFCEPGSQFLAAGNA